MMNLELTRAISDLQDSSIIQLAMNSAVKQGYAIRAEFLHYLDPKTSEDSSKILKRDTKIDLPVIAMDMKLKKLVAFMDPAIAGKPIGLHDWLWHWAIFAALQIDDDKDAALSSLIEISLYCITQMDRESCLNAIDRLWQHRWIYDAQTAAALRKNIITHTSSEQEKGTMNAVVEFEECERNLLSIKEQASNLDDWIEGLYFIIPHLRCAKYLNEMATDQDQEKRDRFLDEALADTGAIFSTIISKSADDSEFWTSSFWPKVKPTPDNIRQVQRELSYKCSARIFYPRFFVNTSLEYFLNGSNGEIPAALNKFDYKHVLSCFLSWIPESAIGHVIDWH